MQRAFLRWDIVMLRAGAMFGSAVRLGDKRVTAHQPQYQWKLALNKSADCGYSRQNTNKLPVAPLPTLISSSK
jgi:hypothetical protein